MKRSILFLILANITIGLFAQSDYFYYPNGEKEYLKVRNDKVIIKIKPEAEAAKVAKQPLFSSVKSIEYSGSNILIADIKEIERVKQMPEISDVAYILESRGSLQSPVDKIFVKPKGRLSINEIINKVGLAKSIRAIHLDESDGIYLLVLQVKIGEILPICQRLFETGLCEIAEPCFLRLNIFQNTYYSNQWGLKNVGQIISDVTGVVGMDIRAENAWLITRGNSNIKVAVIDQGVELNHPDLAANLLNGYNAITKQSGGTNGNPYNTDYSHGTACAGIIGAINNAIGVVGVASSCKIIPVCITTDLSFIDDNTAEGIRYAWQTAQADILSCSWGGGSPATKITTQINNAVNSGRGGKGCIIVFASGNGSSATVSYPASLPNVIAVGNMNNRGLRHSTSNYGSDLNVVAQG